MSEKTQQKSDFTCKDAWRELPPPAVGKNLKADGVLDEQHQLCV